MVVVVQIKDEKEGRRKNAHHKHIANRAACQETRHHIMKLAVNVPTKDDGGDECCSLPAAALSPDKENEISTVAYDLFSSDE